MPKAAAMSGWGTRCVLIGIGTLAGVMSVLAAEVLRSPVAQIPSESTPPEVATASVQRCASGGLRSEQIVCADPVLAALDLMSRNLHQRRSAEIADPRLREQEEFAFALWQHDERDACTTPDCLRAAYKAQLARNGFVID